MPKIVCREGSSNQNARRHSEIAPKGKKTMKLERTLSSVSFPSHLPSYACFLSQSLDYKFHIIKVSSTHLSKRASFHLCILSVSHSFICPFRHFIYSLIHSAIKLIFLVSCAKDHSGAAASCPHSTCMYVIHNCFQKQTVQTQCQSVFRTLCLPLPEPVLVPFPDSGLSPSFPLGLSLIATSLRGLNTSHYTPLNTLTSFISSQYSSLHAIIFYISSFALSLFPLARQLHKSRHQGGFHTFEC